MICISLLGSVFSFTSTSSFSQKQLINQCDRTNLRANAAEGQNFILASTTTLGNILADSYGLKAKALALLKYFGPRTQTVVLLISSNLFMTFAWYGHLKKKGASHESAWYISALVSWSIALFEYLLQVPANKIGFNSGAFTLAQLKILQEVISLAVFVPFTVLFMKQKITLNYLWASLCMLGAAYFTFK